MADSAQAFDEEKITTFLEGLAPDDFGRVLLRLPESFNYVPDKSGHFGRVTEFLVYVRSSRGPGMPRLVEALDKVFPGQSGVWRRAEIGDTNTPTITRNQNIPAFDGPNPFTSRTTITDPALYFEREREQRQLFGFLKKRGNCQIVGEARIGKSSLLLHFARVAREENLPCLVAVLDMHHPICFTLRGFLSRAGMQLGLKPLPTSLVEFSDAIESLCQEGKQPVLCIDNFEEFARRRGEFSRDFFLTLRACGELGMAQVTASRRPLSELTDPDDSTSPYYNAFHIHRLGKFTDSDTADFLTLARPGIPSFSAEEKAQIQQFAQNHPLALQVACYCFVEAKRNGESLQDALQSAVDEMKVSLPTWK